MQWTKAAIVGLIGSLLMFLVMYFGINISGIAPFNVPPSAAFLISLGLPAQPLALLVHFGYGAFWSIVLVALFGDGVTVGNGLGLATGLWLFMMIVYSPIIGWGLFGLGGSGTELTQDAALYLEPGPKYAVMTFLLHMLYGLVVGGLDAVWIETPARGTIAEPA